MVNYTKTHTSVKLYPTALRRDPIYYKYVTKYEKGNNYRHNLRFQFEKVLLRLRKFSSFHGYTTNLSTLLESYDGNE